jgi:predicted ferric reductase
VLLFSCSLVLATLLCGIERAFGGLDLVAQWHRRTAVAGVVLLAAHPSFAGSTPVPDASVLGLRLDDAAALGLSHERWLTGHRLTGLLVAAAVAHGLLVDPVLRSSALLKAAYLFVGGLGIAACIYRELFARFVVPVYDYTVADVQRPGEATVDVFLRPARRPLSFAPGQFIFLAFGGVDGWQRHPFSVASTPSQSLLAVSVKAAGDTPATCTTS